MKKLSVLLVLVVLGSVSFAASLADILEAAKQNGTTLENYRLALENSTLTQKIADVDDRLVVTVMSGTLSARYSHASGGYVYGTTDSNVSLTIPDGRNEETVLAMGSGATSYDAGNQGTTTNPYVDVSHTYVFGYNGDERKKILTSEQNLMNYALTYQKNVIQFENTLYSTLITLLSDEELVRKSQKNVEDQKESMALALRIRTKDAQSLAWKAEENKLAALEKTLAGYQAALEIVKAKYKLYVGQDWSMVEDIPFPELSFSPEPVSATTVKLKQYALELAEENLKIEKASLTNRTLKLAGNLSSPNTRVESTGTQSNQIVMGGDATWKANNWSVAGGVSATYDFQDAQVYPTFTVSGSWTSDATSEADQLTVRKLENTVLLARLEYSNAVNEYLSDAASVMKDTSDWNLSHLSTLNTSAYNKAYLEQQKALFASGLVSQSDVDDASFAVAMDAYEEAIDLLNGLVIQNDIKLLRL